MPKGFRLTPQGKPVLTENDVETACLDLLLRRRWYPVRLQSGLFRTVDGRWLRIGAPGIQDYVVVHEIYPAFFMETKRPRGKLTEKQIRKAWEISTAYRLAVTKVDTLEALIEWLQEHERKAAARW